MAFQTFLTARLAVALTHEETEAQRGELTCSNHILINDQRGSRTLSLILLPLFDFFARKLQGSWQGHGWGWEEVEAQWVCPYSGDHL